jgi:hypothetical protein
MAMRHIVFQMINRQVRTLEAIRTQAFFIVSARREARFSTVRENTQAQASF